MNLDGEDTNTSLSSGLLIALNWRSVVKVTQAWRVLKSLNQYTAIVLIHLGMLIMWIIKTLFYFLWLNILNQFIRNEADSNDLLMNRSLYVVGAWMSPKGVTQGQFLYGVIQIWIQSFPSPRPVAIARLKSPIGLRFINSERINKCMYVSCSKVSSSKFYFRKEAKKILFAFTMFVCRA